MTRARKYLISAFIVLIFTVLQTSGETQTESSITSVKESVSESFEKTKNAVGSWFSNSAEKIKNIQKPQNDPNVLLKDEPLPSVADKAKSSADKWISNSIERVKTEQRIRKKKKELANEKKNPKNLMPQTYEEYFEKSQDIKSYLATVPSPTYSDNPKMEDVEPPRFVFKKYNDPPGSVDLDLSDLKMKGVINSAGVASSENTKLAYSAVYFNSSTSQVSSEVYYIPLDMSLTPMERIKRANKVNRITTPLMSTGMDGLYYSLQRTFTIVDWSKDGEKLAVKEIIGSKDDGRWQTNLWVYDFKTKKARNLVEVREAIKYWWKVNKNLNIDDYRWDIFPLGWDAEQPDNRIVLYAVAYTKTRSKFLGTWSIDYNANRSMPLSFKDTNYPVASNGIVLKLKI